MKIKLFMFLMLSMTISQIFASVPIKRNTSTIPEYLIVENFLRYNVAGFEQATGKKLNVFQKMYFKKLQKKVSKTKYPKQENLLSYYDVQKQKFKLDPLWLILGAIIGPFAVLFSYTSHKQTRSKHISALIGFGIFILWFGWVFLF